MAQPVCASCHQPFSADEITATYKKKAYHQACYDAMKSAARAKDVKASAALNDPDYLALENFLKSLYSLSSLTPLLTRQIKDLHTGESCLSYADILLALQYFYNIEENKPLDQPSIGIVPYVVEEARKVRDCLRDAREHNSRYTPKDDTVTVYIKDQSAEPSRINIEDL